VGNCPAGYAARLRETRELFVHLCFCLLFGVVGVKNRITMTYLTVPIAAKDIESAKEQIKAAQKGGAEMIELRVDYLDQLNASMVRELISETRNIFGRKKLPIIVTCRSVRHGGEIAYPDQLRVNVLVGALQVGAEFIDLEYESFLSTENKEKIIRALSQSSKGRLILSAHNFNGKFDDMRKLHRRIMTVYPAAIPKLVYKANHINDCFEAFDLLHSTSGERIIFCMGQAGLVSRIIAKKLGAMVTFASLDEKTATAPGQLTIDRLKKLYRFGDINSETELYGVIAFPAAHSLSPAIHNACFGKARLNKLYLPLLVEGGKAEFGLFMNNILNRGWLNFRGFSVTIPHKQNALNFVGKNQGFVEPLAKKIGAVNTILCSRAGTLKAYNTDYAGALDAITSKLCITRNDFKDMPIAVIGAGGVSRALVAGLSDAGADLKIYNRTVEKARKLASEFGCSYAPLEDLENIEANLVINCTSIGMHPDIDATPLPKELLKKDMAVFDTVYNPSKTLLLQQAKQKRAKTVDGVSMFVNQACEQFKLFTGTEADVKLMSRVLKENL